MQELAQASHVLQVIKACLDNNCSVEHKVLSMCFFHLPPQEKLSEKQKLLEEQQRETAVLREELSTLQVRKQPCNLYNIVLTRIS